MTRPRLLLIEDDASIRRFVMLALEDDNLELVEAPSLAAASQALRGGPFDVVMCDLMLPDGSGLDLLRELAAPDSPCPGAWRVAFSAGVSAAVRQQLEQIGVHQVLSKPVSLAELSACVAAGLARFAPGPGVHEPEAAAVPPVPAPTQTAHMQAIAEFFGGDASLYAAFRAQCVQQFGRDIAAGDQALAAGDLAALHRLAHSLKSVLLTLGHGSDSACAARLESCAAQRQAVSSAALWGSLAQRLRVLTE